MNDFENKFRSTKDNYSVSIKIRNVNVGCYSRQCCPNAYRLIDKEISSMKDGSNFLFLEHETGPEILVYITITAAGISLASNIISLITTIIKARFEGQKRGDNHKYPVELIIRRTLKKDKFKEEKILRINSLNEYSDSEIKDEVMKAVKKLIERELKKKRK